VKPGYAHVWSVLEIIQFVDGGRLTLSIDAWSGLSTLVYFEYVRTVPVDLEITFRAASLSPDLSCQ
jgi:hypothetical protein